MSEHYHHCPSCYEIFPCLLECTIEPDLEDNGRQFGSHCFCDSCVRSTYPQLNRMLKGWDRIYKQFTNPREYRYTCSDDNFHYFSSSKRFFNHYEIKDGDFDIDFEKYNGFKKVS